MSYAIEDGVPLPPHPKQRQNGGRKPIYPIAALEPGQSFFVPGKTSAALRGTVYQIELKTGRKFSMRTVDGGVRVWRVS